jgi:inner membrane protein
MPTIMTHAAVPLAAGFALGPTRVPRSVVVIGVMLAMLPDIDTVSFLLGIDYADPFGHRGASHSLFAAGVIALTATALLRLSQWRATFAFLFASMASHGLLDALTSGGLGPALLWPFEPDRLFARFRPIRVSPIGGGFFSMRGLVVLLSEAQWVWLPAISAAVMLRWLLPNKTYTAAKEDPDP